MGPEVIAIIASFVDAFYELIKLRGVSKTFSQVVVQCGEYRITEKDRNIWAVTWPHACRVAEGKTILLDPGMYELEATYHPYPEKSRENEICDI